MTEQARVESRLGSIEREDFARLVRTLTSLTTGNYKTLHKIKYLPLIQMLNKYNLTFSDLYNYTSQRVLIEKFAKTCPDFPNFKGDPAWDKLVEKMHSS